MASAAACISYTPLIWMGKKPMDGGLHAFGREDTECDVTVDCHKSQYDQSKRVRLREKSRGVYYRERVMFGGAERNDENEETWHTLGIVKESGVSSKIMVFNAHILLHHAHTPCIFF